MHYVRLEGSKGLYTGAMKFMRGCSRTTNERRPEAE